MDGLNRISILIYEQYITLKTEVEKLKNELTITRNYIHDNGLEWDLLSYSKRKEKGNEETIQRP